MAMLDQSMLSKIGAVSPLALQQQLGQAWSLPLGGGGITLGTLLSSIFGGDTSQTTTATPEVGAAGSALTGGAAPAPGPDVAPQPTSAPGSAMLQAPTGPPMGVPDLIRSLADKPQKPYGY